MTSIEVWERFSLIIDKDANGNIRIPELVRLFNMAQNEYMMEAIGDQREYKLNYGAAKLSPELSYRMQNMLSAFTITPRYVNLTNRVGTYNPGGNEGGNFVGDLKVWISQYQNPGCGEVSIEAGELEVTLITQREWMTRTVPNRYDGPSLEFPLCKLVNDKEIEVRPREIKSVWITYIRLPLPISIELLPDGINYNPLSTTNANPEWNAVDCEAIIDRVVGLAGMKEQNQGWIAYAERRANK